MSEEAVIFELRIGIVASGIEGRGLGSRCFQQVGRLRRRHLVSRLLIDSLTGKYGGSARCDSFGRSQNRVVLGVDVSQELRDYPLP